MQLTIGHLVSLGHIVIAHISGGDGAGARGRVEGYIVAMRSHGLEKNILIIEGEYTEETGSSGAERLLVAKKVPTAIFAANDLVTAGAMATTTIEQPLAESRSDAVRLLI